MPDQIDFTIVTVMLGLVGLCLLVALSVPNVDRALREKMQSVRKVVKVSITKTSGYAKPSGGVLSTTTVFSVGPRRTGNSRLSLGFLNLYGACEIYSFAGSLCYFRYITVFGRQFYTDAGHIYNLGHEVPDLGIEPMYVLTSAEVVDDQLVAACGATAPAGGLAFGGTTITMTLDDPTLINHLLINLQKEGVFVNTEAHQRKRMRKPRS